MTVDPAALETLVAYLHERERIRILKESGAPRPWTKDHALSTFKFTNVLRENDYTSRWLVQNWYEPHKDAPLEEILLNCGTARYFGTTQFAEALGWSAEWQPARVKALAAQRAAQGLVTFTNAYVITNGGISAPKYQVVCDEYLTPFSQRLNEIIKIGNASSAVGVNEIRWQPMAEWMMRHLPGFGGTGFMCKEVLSDFILATRGRLTWLDLTDWTPIGPGAQKGLNFMFGRGREDKVSKTQYLREIREVRDALRPRLEGFMPPVCDDLHAIQFAMCEIEKYRKVREGGRMKNYYKPRNAR